MEGYLESDSQEVQDPNRQSPALVEDLRGLALVRRQRGGDGLLRLSVDELAKVEGPTVLARGVEGRRAVLLLKISRLGVPVSECRDKQRA